MRGAFRSAALIVASLLVLVAGCAGEPPGQPDEAAPDSDASTDDHADAAIDDQADADDEADRDEREESGEETDGSARAEEPSLSVAATVAPIADLVRMVGGDRVEVDSLVPPGVDSHGYEPRPRDVARLADADAYLGVGLDLNPAAIRLAEENLPDHAPLVLLGEVSLTDDEIVYDHSHGDEDDGHGHDHDDGHSHDHDDGHNHDHEDGHSHDHERLGPNAHVWTSLRNAIALVGTIADTLSDLDPAGADRYRTNAAAAQERLADLDDLIGDAAATIPADHRTLITYHDAWSYFARDYRLDFATAVQPADFSEPSAAEVRAVIDLIREREVPAVFGSEVFPTPVLETIAEETGATYVGDLSDDVLPGEPGTDEHTYLEMMRRNAVTIVSGLGGDVSQLEG